MAPAVFTVDKFSDTGVVGDIRWAVNQANAFPGPDTIEFNLGPGGVQTINLSSPLNITNSELTINGFSQPGTAANTATFGDPINAMPGIVLRNVTTVANAIIVSANDSTIKGLVIQGFTNYAIAISGYNNKIQGCFIGTNATGTGSAPNGSGIVISDGADGNLIGGINRADRNLISGNKFTGVAILGVVGVGVVAPNGADENKVQGNYIGTDITGIQKVPNGSNGVWISGPANENLIGGPEDEAPNLISGNGENGVLLHVIVGIVSEPGTTSLNKIVHNRIGTNGPGTAALGNGKNGVNIIGVGSNTVGGGQPNERNIISGNTGAGVRIEGQKATSNQVFGNYIGTDLNGTAILGNRIGVVVDRTGVNNIGGVQAGQRNVISGNNEDGVFIDFADGVLVQGNYIGIDKDGNLELRNKGNGILINNCTNVVISGKNVISGNGTDPQDETKGNGVRVIGGDSNRIQDNYIGTDAAGKAPRANLVDGVSVEAAMNTYVGGFGLNERNLIDANKRAVYDSVGSKGTVIKNNSLGKGEDGAVLPNEQGGILLNGSQAEVVGNEIWYNGGPGIAVVAGTGNRISQVSILNNAGLGIDLGGDGRTANDYGDPLLGIAPDTDVGPNNLQNYPDLTAAVVSGGRTFVQVTLASTPNTTFLVEFFGNNVLDAAEAQGERFLGYAWFTTDANGYVEVSADLPDVYGTFLTATATDPDGNTSEFSLAVPIDVAVPEVTGLNPSFGPTSGGTAVTITGFNFTGVTDVFFGSVAAAFTLVSDSEITATAPGQAAGTVDVTVVTGAGASAPTPAGWFTYVATPIRTEPGFSASTLGPTDDGSAGPIDLGFTVDFFGQLYSTVYVNNNGTVTFDGPLIDWVPFDLTTSTIPILAPFFADVDTTVGPVVSYGTGTVDGHAAFAVNWIAVGYFAQHLDKTNSFQLVLIDRSDVAPGAFDVEFNYGRIEWETGDSGGGVEGLGGQSARAGYANGSGIPGTSHELAGSGVNGAFLDSDPTTGLIHNSENSGGVLGRYVYEIRGGGGGGGGAAAFSGGGTAPAAASSVPVVRGVKALAGPTAGGTRVTILGTNFSGVSGVFFGTTPASSFTVLSPRRIVATAPPHAAGTLNVRVTTGGGSSLPAPASRFSYVAAPVVTALSQASGSTRGGTTVTLTGTNFTGVTAVFFGTTPARSFRVLSPTQLTVIVPARLPGTVEVRVAAAGGLSTASLAARYTYVAVPRVTGLSRTSGSTAGGYSLTLTGANFLGVTAVFIGSRLAAFTVQSPTRVTVVVPAGTAGPVNVRLVAAGGSSPVSPATRFTYVVGSAAGPSAAPAGGSGSDTPASDPLDPFSVDVVMALQYDADSEQP